MSTKSKVLVGTLISHIIGLAFDINNMDISFKIEHPKANKHQRPQMELIESLPTEVLGHPRGCGN